MMKTKSGLWMKYSLMPITIVFTFSMPFPISPFSITLYFSSRLLLLKICEYYLSHRICLKENKTEIVLYAKWNWLMNIFRCALIRGKFEIIYIGREYCHSAYLNYTHMQIPMLKCNGLENSIVRGAIVCRSPHYNSPRDLSRKRNCFRSKYGED